MAMLTTDEVLAQLGVPQADVFRHAAVDTVDAQAEALLDIDASIDTSRIAKNLFLKDNRGRFYLCTALKNTSVRFEKELAVRLGLKKSELRMADADALAAALALKPGSVTPLAACQPCADRVVVLLDHQLRSGPFFVHPLVNTASVLVTAERLVAFLRQHGREGHFVDFEVTDVKIDKENPPDLKAVADTVPEAKVKKAPAAVPAGTDSKKDAKAKRSAAKGGAGGNAAQATSTADLDDPATCVRTIVEKVQAMVSESPSAAGGLSEQQLRALAMDLTVEVNSLRNAAYARGMQAARGAMMAKLSRAWD